MTNICTIILAVAQISRKTIAKSWRLLLYVNYIDGHSCVE